MSFSFIETGKLPPLSVYQLLRFEHPYNRVSNWKAQARPGPCQGQQKGLLLKRGCKQMSHIKLHLARDQQFSWKSDVGEKTENNPSFWVSVQDTQLLWTAFPPFTARRGINLFTGLKKIHSLLARNFIFYPTDKRSHKDILGCPTVLFIIVKNCNLSKYPRKDWLNKSEASIWQSMVT